MVSSQRNQRNTKISWSTHLGEHSNLDFEMIRKFDKASNRKLRFHLADSFGLITIYCFFVIYSDRNRRQNLLYTFYCDCNFLCRFMLCWLSGPVIQWNLELSHPMCSEPNALDFILHFDHFYSKIFLTSYPFLTGIAYNF